MTVISNKSGDDFSVDYSSIFELAVKVFYLSQYRKLDGFGTEKNLYRSSRNEFIEKFRLKYPKAENDEIFNFVRIYLLYQPAENNHEKSDFLFDGRIPVNRLSWMGPYLQEKGDYKYSWLVENLEKNIHHP